MNIGRRGEGNAAVPRFVFWDQHNPGFENLAAYLPDASMNLSRPSRLSIRGWLDSRCC